MKKLISAALLVLLGSSLSWAGATFSRLKTWSSGEILTASDLNAEFNNILNNLTPSGIDDYSATTTEMRSTADPYPGLSEDLPTSLQGEIERLRYQILQIKRAIAVSSGTYWYEDVPSSGTLNISNGKVGIGTVVPTSSFTVAGTMNVTGGLTVTGIFTVGTLELGDGSQIAGRASPTDQEAGTAPNYFVTPVYQQRHASAAKAWVVFTGTGTPTIIQGYNVTSITDNGVGDYTLNFTSAFSSAEYACTGIATWKSGAWAASLMQDQTNRSSTTTSAFRLNVRDTATQLTVDADRVHVVCYGDQ